MTICKYFQQGTCRYGNRCRFEHSFIGGGGNVGGGGTPTSGYGSSSGTSIFNRNKPGGQYTGSGFFNQAVPALQKSNAPTPDLRDLMQMVITELIQSERGGQWPLSCFAPFKEQGCFPGLEDHSPDELRYLMYEAVRTGNLDECTRKIKALYERTSTVKKQILNPTPEVYSIVEKLFKRLPIESNLNPSFTPQLGSAILSQTPAAPTNFTFALSPGAASNVPSNFVSPPSIFGNASSNVTHSSSIFAVPPQNAASTNQSIFGGANQHPAPFGNVMPSNQSFQQAPANNNPFFSDQNKGQLGGSILNQNKGVFGGSTTNWSQVDKSVSEDTVYTALSELSEDEKSLFSSKTFTMGKVPIKAPAKELCL